jgi:hypothetical protein
MTLLQHGGFVPPCVVGDVPDARFGTELLDRQNESWPSAPGPLRHLCIPDLGSDVGHFAGTGPEIVNFLCKESA